MHRMFLERVDKETASAPPGIAPPTPLQRHTAEGFQAWVVGAIKASQTSEGGGPSSEIHVEEEVPLLGTEKRLTQLLQPFFEYLDREMIRDLYESW